MVKDAEAHAEEDRKFHELVNARNQADTLVHASKKSLEDLADKVDENERKEIESAIETLEKAIEGDDVEDIVGKTQQLGELSGKIAQKAYEAQQAEADGDAAAETVSTAEGDADDGNVVDADFEEVKDDK